MVLLRLMTNDKYKQQEKTQLLFYSSSQENNQD